MKIKRRVKIFALCFLIVMFFLGGSLIIVVNNSNGVRKKYYRNNDFIFTFRTLGFNIVGFKEGISPCGIKLMGINRGKIINSGRIEGEDPSFYFTDDSYIYLYTSQGEKKYKPLDDGKKILSCCIDDLNKDSIPEILVISKEKANEYGDELIIFFCMNKMKEIYRHSLSALNPWKVQTADVDGDGAREISIGVYKTTVFHPVMAKRPFVYGWDGEKIYSKWLGSRLSKPFDDYIFADIDGDGMDEIISIELEGDGRKLLNSYKWKGFGFEAIGSSSEYSDICELSSIISKTNAKNKISARVKIDNKWRRVELCFKENSIIEWNE